MRWSWKLQEWSPNIQYIKCKDIVVADFLPKMLAMMQRLWLGNRNMCFRLSEPIMYHCHDRTYCSLATYRDTIMKHQVDAVDRFYANYETDQFVKLNSIIYKVYENKDLPVINDSIIPDVIHQ
jgi:hypothetical protein